MTEELYLSLIEQSKLFCRSIHIDYMNFLHDVICEYEELNEQNYKELFLKKKHNISSGRARDVSLDDIWRQRSRLTIYKWCPHCDLILPEYEFPIQYGRYRAKYCKEGIRMTGRSKKSQKNRRDNLSDGYIIDVLKKNGYNKDDITQELIEEKRNKIMQKRTKKLEFSNEISNFN